MSLGFTVNKSNSYNSIEYAIYSVTFEVDTRISTKNRLIVCFEKSAIKMERSRILTHANTVYFHLGNDNQNHLQGLEQLG